jgi:hypothetical protein
MNLATIIGQYKKAIIDKEKIISESMAEIEELRKQISKVVPPLKIAMREIRINMDGELAFHRERQAWSEFVLNKHEMKELYNYLQNYYEDQLPE